MSDFSTVTIESSIVSTDRIELKIKIIEPNNIQSNEFVYIWDSTRNELITKKCPEPFEEGVISGNFIAINNNVLLSGGGDKLIVWQ
jgi:hypothetical protein